MRPTSNRPFHRRSGMTFSEGLLVLVTAFVAAASVWGGRPYWGVNIVDAPPDVSTAASASDSTCPEPNVDEAR
jgi:hypothetical protein